MSVRFRSFPCLPLLRVRPAPVPVRVLCVSVCFRCCCCPCPRLPCAAPRVHVCLGLRASSCRCTYQARASLPVKMRVRISVPFGQGNRRFHNDFHHHRHEVIVIQGFCHPRRKCEGRSRSTKNASTVKIVSVGRVGAHGLVRGAPRHGLPRRAQRQWAGLGR